MYSYKFGKKKNINNFSLYDPIYFVEEFDKKDNDIILNKKNSLKKI